MWEHNACANFFHLYCITVDLWDTSYQLGCSRQCSNKIWFRFSRSMETAKPFFLNSSKLFFRTSPAVVIVAADAAAARYSVWAGNLDSCGYRLSDLRLRGVFGDLLIVIKMCSANCALDNWRNMWHKEATSNYCK